MLYVSEKIYELVIKKWVSKKNIMLDSKKKWI